MNQNNTSNELSIVDIINQLKDFVKFYKKKKFIAISLIAGGMCLGIAASLIIHTKYIAQLSFAAEDSESSGGSISSLASQFGISLGAGSGGAFGGDNIYELFTSRFIIEKVLLSPMQIEGKRSNLISLYMQSYGIDNQLKNSDEKDLRETSFNPDKLTDKLTRSQDSIVGVIYQSITKKMLVAEKRNKKLSIGDITFTSRNETLSKLFVEELIRHTSSFYIETKTKVTRTNYLLLKHQTDSVKREYERALTERAYLADNSLNTVRQSSNIGIMKKQTDIQVAMNAYIEMKKNMEMLKYSLAKETPLVQVIDKPTLPLEKKELKPAKGGAFGFVGGFLLSVVAIALIYLREKFSSLF